MTRIPREPYLRPRHPNRRTEERQRALGEGLGFFDPRHVIAFERLDTLSGMILHTLKDNDAVSRSLDVRVHHAEVTSEGEGADLIFEEALDRLFERLLYLTDADRSRRFGETPFEEEFRENV